MEVRKTTIKRTDEELERALEEIKKIAERWENDTRVREILEAQRKQDREGKRV